MKPVIEARKVWGHTGIKVLGHTSSRNVPWNVPVTSTLIEPALLITQLLGFFAALEMGTKVALFYWFTSWQ